MVMQTMVVQEQVELVQEQVQVQEQAGPRVELPLL
jgi:hypothetical protein